MTAAAKPEPLVPADIDISGLSSFMLDVERLFASELWALSSGDEFKAALALWGRAWQQTPAGSLPNDERLLAAFSGAGPRWKKVREMALRGFVACSDGRLYHKTLCEDVLRAARKKEEQRQRTAAATEARRRRPNPDETPPERPSRLPGIDRDEDRHVQRHDDRHDDRHGPRTVNVTKTVTRSQGQYSTGKIEDSPPGPCDPVPAPGRAGGWSDRANLERVEARCRRDLDGGGPQDLVIGPIARLEAEGYDLEAEIVPALIDIASSGRSPIRTWRLYAERIRERVDQDRAARPADGPPKRDPSRPTVAIRHRGTWYVDDLRKVIAKWREVPGSWPVEILGRPPGEPECVIPREFIVEAAA